MSVISSNGALRLTIVYEIPPGGDARYLLASPHMVASSWSDALATRPVPANWHADDGSIDEFAQVLKDKMRTSREKGRATWRDPSYGAAEISRHLREHVEKGDPRDVAIYCMFLLAKAARIEPREGPSADDMWAELQVLREIAEGFMALGAKSDLEDPAYISEIFPTFAAAEADARASGYLLVGVEALKKPSCLPHCLPLSDSYVDHQLEIVLRAAGTALRHYADGTKAEMRCAMRSAMGVVDEVPSSHARGACLSDSPESDRQVTLLRTDVGQAAKPMALQRTDRAAFEALASDSFNFKKSRRGFYVNPPISRDWKWFQAGASHARASLPAGGVVQPMSEQDAALIMQGVENLNDFADEQDMRGNNSTAAGARCSAHAVHKIAAQYLEAAKQVPQPPPTLESGQTHGGEV